MNEWTKLNDWLPVLLAMLQEKFGAAKIIFPLQPDSGKFDARPI